MLSWEGFKFFIYVVVGIYCIWSMIKDLDFRWQHIVWLLLLALTIITGVYREDLGFVAKVFDFITNFGLLLVLFLRA